MNPAIRSERWVINDGINPVTTVRSPDLGLLLHPNPPTRPPAVIPRAFFAELFKIPTLWGDRGHRTLLPQQRREDAARRRRSLSAVLQFHGGVGSGRFTVPGRFDRADRHRRRRHRRVPKAARTGPEAQVGWTSSTTCCSTVAQPYSLSLSVSPLRLSSTVNRSATRSWDPRLRRGVPAGTTRRASPPPARRAQRRT